MNDLRLTIKLEGPAGQEGEIELRRLTQFGDLFQRMLDRVAATYLGQEDDYGEVKPPRQETALRPMAVEQGSFRLELGLQPSEQPDLFETGPKALEALVAGLDSIYRDGPGLPPGYDQTVLRFWREIGQTVLKSDIEQIRLTLQSPTSVSRVTYDYNLYQKVIRRIVPPKTRKIVLKGRLLIVNFNENRRRCRLYLDDGNYVACVFDAEIAPKIQEAMRHYVRIWGTAEMEATTRKIRRLKVQGVTILARAEDEPEKVSDPAEVVDETVASADPDELEEISDYLSLKNFDLYRRLAQ